MRLSSFPWLVVETGRYWLPDQAAYTDEPPAQYGQIATELKLSELLAKIGLNGPSLAFEKRALSDRVDADAERERMRYLTPGYGMAQVYEKKQAQAAVVLALGQTAADALADDGAAEFPILAASVGIEAASLWDVATLVDAKARQFGALGYGIERVRLAAKKAIAEAEDLTAARAVYAAVDWSVGGS